MVYHPNFPPSLSIIPNLHCFTKEALGYDQDTFAKEAQQEAISKYGIAGRVWEASYALCAYVDPDLAFEFDPPFADDPSAPLRVIELGSGTGVVAASISGAIRRVREPGGFVVATDLPDVYFPELLGPLLRTLIHLTDLFDGRSGPPTKIIISYKLRSLVKETPFWSAFGLWFTFGPVLVRHRVAAVRNALLGEDSDTAEPWRQFGAHKDTDRTFVFVAHRRPESTAWHVPETDHELLGGVGARGTIAKKGDDTFETILLMGMGIDNTVE